MFNKNKKKIDSRIRFQNSRFTRKLESARSYKRTTRILPKNQKEVFLSRIGLSSWLSRIITGGVFLFLIYIVYIPNFLFIKHINISGGDQATNSTVQNITNSYLDKKLPWPQSNLILLSKGDLKNYIITNDQKVLSVDKITKHFPNRLDISVTPRLDQFLLETASSTDFTISNDGIVTSEIIPDASNTLPNLPFLIKLDSSEDIIPGAKALTENNINFIKQVSGQLPEIIKSPVNYYSMEDLTSTDLTVYSKTGLKVIFDLNSDIEKTLNSLRLLFSQFQDSDINKLYYVDMRFSGKSYVCQKGTACVNPISLPVSNSTSTTP